MPNFLNPLQPKYWFGNYPSYSSVAMPTMLIVFVLLAVLGIFIYIFLRKAKIDSQKKKFFRGWPGLFVWTSLFLLFFWFCRYQRAYILSMRFWMIFVAVIFLVYLIKDIVRYRREYPQIVARRKQQAASAKYRMVGKKKKKKRK